MTELAHNELHRIAVTGIIWRESEKGYEYLITKRSPETREKRGSRPISRHALSFSQRGDAIKARGNGCVLRNTARELKGDLSHGSNRKA